MPKKLDSSRFLHSIDRYAKKRRLRDIEIIRKNERERLERKEKELLRSNSELMMSELASVKARVSLEIYRARAQAMQKVCKRRIEIRDEVFELCKKKIDKFTQSEGYVSRLVRSIENVSNLADGSVCVFLREDDLSHIDELKTKFPAHNFSVSKKIKCGGLLFKIGNKVLDDTFDSSLKEQKKWFFENCYCKLL